MNYEQEIQELKAEVAELKKLIAPEKKRSKIRIPKAKVNKIMYNQCLAIKKQNQL